MPRAFSLAEREQILSRLREAGLRLFATQGLRKTSLEDLAGPAGIVKSTFYAFFDSKEALYLDLMLDRAAEVKRRVVDEGLRRGTDTADALRRFLRASLEVLASDPLYRRLVTHPVEMRAVAAKAASRPLTQLGDADPATALSEFVVREQEAGRLIDVPTSVLIGALQTVLLLPMHEDELGTDQYPQILDLVIELVVTGLTTRSRS